MAIDFPNSPSVDEIYSVGDKSWLWNGTYWEVQGSPTSTFSASDTAPASPSVGDIWYRSDTSQTLIYYDSTWVEIGHSANIANFLADADADTKIQLEESSDEDTIRFDIAGSEKMALNASSLTVYDSLSVGSGASASSFDASGSGANLMPSGTTAERPGSPTAGMFRFNETTGEPEWYSSALSQWINFRSLPAVDISYLIVAGGGGGGGTPGGASASIGGGGGGGAGGLLSDVIAASTFTVTVGAGGSGSSGTSRGASGTNSSIADNGGTTLTAVGGGGGGSYINTGLSGGSGGGGGEDQSGGSGTAFQGNDGGSGGGDNFGGAGGGGAGAAGSNSTGGAGAAGGIGVTSTIISDTYATSISVGEVSGGSVYFAGGGSGGAGQNASGADSGGTGGGGTGGKGSPTTAPTSGSSNTGGGGGGGAEINTSVNTGGNGGSGVVIIRYPNSLTPSVSVGLTSTTTTVGSDKVTVFTAGTGTVTWA